MVRIFQTRGEFTDAFPKIWTTLIFSSRYSEPVMSKLYSIMAWTNHMAQYKFGVRARKEPPATLETTGQLKHPVLVTHTAVHCFISFLYLSRSLLRSHAEVLFLFRPLHSLVTPSKIVPLFPPTPYSIFCALVQYAFFQNVDWKTARYLATLFSNSFFPGHPFVGSNISLITPKQLPFYSPRPWLIPSWKAIFPISISHCLVTAVRLPGNAAQLLYQSAWLTTFFFL